MIGHIFHAGAKIQGYFVSHNYIVNSTVILHLFKIA